MHNGWADPYDYPKCGYLKCIIFVSGGLRSRHPPNKYIMFAFQSIYINDIQLDCLQMVTADIGCTNLLQSLVYKETFFLEALK